MIDLFQPGALARSAGGNLERPDIQAPVVKWMAWSINSDNGMGGDPKAWARCRTLWSDAGIQQFPWKHCRSLADVQELINVAITYNSPAIGLNIEDVVDDKIPPQQIAAIVLDKWVNPHGGAVHMPTLCWVQNGQGWQYLSFAVAALEMFYDEVPSCKDVDGCVKHAFAEGLKNVTLMFKTKLPPSDYDLSVCHSLFTADDIQPDAPSWNAWKAPTPCKKLGGDVPLSPTLKKHVRQEIAAYCVAAEKANARWAYSQARPYHGLGDAPQTWHSDDCSSYCALVYYWASKHVPVYLHDCLNEGYNGFGNTETAHAYLSAHPITNNAYYVGDIAMYLQGPQEHHHMMVCRKNGNATSSVWSEMGSEAGPNAQVLHYRTDLTGVYRHPALL